MGDVPVRHGEPEDQKVLEVVVRDPEDLIGQHILRLRDCGHVLVHESRRRSVWRTRFEGTFFGRADNRQESAIVRARIGRKLHIRLDGLAPFVLLDGLTENRDQLRLAGRAADPRVHHRSLSVERRCAGALLILDVGAESLVGLHRHRLSEVRVARDGGECVLTPEPRIAVATQEA